MSDDDHPYFRWQAPPPEQLIAPDGLIVELRSPDGKTIIMRQRLPPGVFESLKINYRYLPAGEPMGLDADPVRS